MRHLLKAYGLAAITVFLAIVATGCTSTKAAVVQCNVPTGPSMQESFQHAKTDLLNGCSRDFYEYFEALLTVAEGDPKPENRQEFSRFLVWSQKHGLVNQAMAKDLYNRYFNIKYVALTGDFSNCSSTCTNLNGVLGTMQQEAQDKEQGIMRVCGDSQGYARADRLLRETELVLMATCNACEAEQKGN